MQAVKKAVAKLQGEELLLSGVLQEDRSTLYDLRDYCTLSHFLKDFALVLASAYPPGANPLVAERASKSILCDLRDYSLYPVALPETLCSWTGECPTPPCC